MGSFLSVIWGEDECCYYCQRPTRPSHSARTWVAVIIFVALIVPLLYHTHKSDRYEVNKIKSGMRNVKTKLKEVESRVEALNKYQEKSSKTTHEVTHIGRTDNKLIRGLLREELEIYDSDKTGLPDFALEALGGCIVSTRKTQSYKSVTFGVFGVPIISHTSDPRAVIQPTVQPGTCWAFYGDMGEVVIQLYAKIFVTHVSLEHISPKLMPTGDILSAPKTFSIWGLTHLRDTTVHFFGSFDYQKEGPTVQVFKIQHPSSQPYQLVEVKFVSNHGDPRITCVYRVRVHGRVAQ